MTPQYCVQQESIGVQWESLGIQQESVGIQWESIGINRNIAFKYRVMFDYIHEEVQRRINWSVEHSPYSLSDKDIKDLEAVEYSLVRTDEL